jgi:hypothetical protein
MNPAHMEDFLAAIRTDSDTVGSPGLLMPDAQTGFAWAKVALPE